MLAFLHLVIINVVDEIERCKGASQEVNHETKEQIFP